ncbi:MAG: hypothetical protein RIF36_22470 [Imperialibacter sp.]|uniref:hypothetical protein n=1 Tax=Imperialibacter sp. TaxID=2038411 RepID=UPI0032EB43AB
MARLLILCLLVFSSVAVAAQPKLFRVMLAKKAFDQNGNRIKTNAAISRYQTVLVKEGGSLEMDVESRLDLVLGPRTHDLDVLERQHSYRYRHHDSLKVVVFNKGIGNCKFSYRRIVVPGAPNGGFDASRIQIQGKLMTTIDKDSAAPLTITWENPDKKFKGKYFLVVQDAFNTAYLDVIETEATSVVIYPTSYDVPYMQYYIRADDCRGSVNNGIKVE